MGEHNSNHAHRHRRLLLQFITATSLVAAPGCSGDEGTETEAIKPMEEALHSDAGAWPACKTEWGNPRDIPNPRVAAVPADAGLVKIFETEMVTNAHDYVVEEFFVSNDSPAQYVTRFVVRRPRDMSKFTGTVFAEWYNVSGGFDVAVMWGSSQEYMMREGHVFVGVSAQAVGANSLRDVVDSDRYGEILHPGDQFAADIFSQIGVAIRTQTGKLFGTCAEVTTLLAAGQSQSAGQLTRYVNNSHSTAQVYDGFMLHSGGEPDTNDLDVPVFVIFTMSEGNGSLEPGPNLVKWVVAGASHNDAHIVERNVELGELAGLDGELLSECANPLNQFPAWRVYTAALDWLDRWVTQGDRPPNGMPFETESGRLKVDADGNGVGGVRIAEIEVPHSMYGLANGPADPLNLLGYLICGIGGTTIRFEEERLLELYPTHEDYVRKFVEASDKALEAGFILQQEHDLGIEEAMKAAIPN